MSLNYRLLLVLLLTTGILVAVRAQNEFNFQNFKGLEQSGSLPADLTTGWAEKYQAELRKNESRDLKRKKEKRLEEFWGKQHHGIDEMLQSGRFSFGDPIANYLQDITDKLLANHPDIADEVRVYYYKSPSVNAFSVADGIIGIHTGLLAHAKSEAEIAFVIAHEIAHYTQRHSFDRYRQREALNNRGFFSSSINPIAKVDRMLRRSQEHELDADLQGFNIYENSVYAPAAVDSAMSTLHHSYITFGRKSVGKDFLSTESFQIPRFFFRSEVASISKEEDYFDETHSHPNIFTRRMTLSPELRRADTENKALFPHGEERFKNIRDLARFEMIREKIVYANYGEALYDIYVMQERFPDNRFLELSKVRALYGLASFKSIDEISAVLPSTSQVEGPTQQVFHILKQLHCEQMNAVALHHVLRAKKKYPDAAFLDAYADNLTKYMKIYCEVEAEEFEVDQPTIPEFDKTVEDFSSERRYIRAKQVHYDNFHKYLLYDQIQNGWLVEKLKEHQSVKDSLDRELELTADFREERRENRIDKLDEQGTGLDIRKMSVLDPRIVIKNEEETDADDLLDNLEEENEFKREFIKLAREQGLEAIPVYTSAMSSSDIDLYEQYSKLKEWTFEARMFKHLNLAPIHREIIKNLDLPTRYVCQVEGRIFEDSDDYFYFGVYDLKKGEVVYQRSSEQGNNLRLREMEKESEKHLFRVSH